MNNNVSAGSCGGSWLASDTERPTRQQPLTSSSSASITGMPPSGPHGRVTVSRPPTSSSRLSSVLPRPFRRRPRAPDPRSATLPPAQQPLLAVAGRPCSPYDAPRHWYDPGSSGCSRTLPSNGRTRPPPAARHRIPPDSIRRRPDARNGGWQLYGQSNGGPGRRHGLDGRHSADLLDTWLTRWIRG